ADNFPGSVQTRVADHAAAYVGPSVRLQVTQVHRLATAGALSATAFGPGMQWQSEELATDPLIDGHFAVGGSPHVVLPHDQNRTDCGDGRHQGGEHCQADEGALSLATQHLRIW